MLVVLIAPDAVGIDNDQQVILAVIALASMLAAALVYLVKGYGNSKTAAEQATAANKAVNDIGPGDHRLYDKVTHLATTVDRLVIQQEEFLTHGWGNLPQDLNNAVQFTETIRDLERGVVSNAEKIDTILNELREHIHMSHHYPVTE